MGESGIIIKDGVAYVPFNAEQLIWLIDQFSVNDTYRQVLWDAYKVIESPDSLAAAPYTTRAG